MSTTASLNGSGVTVKAGSEMASPSCTSFPIKHTPQQQQLTENGAEFSKSYILSSNAAKVTPPDDLDPSKQKVRFASLSKRGRYTSPGRRAVPLNTVEQSAQVGSPAPSLCSAPSHDEPKNPTNMVTKEEAPSSPVTDPTKSPTGLYFQASPGVTRTPTSFATDYSSIKPGCSNGNFDTSNVLAWLQSPTGLFSPGWNSMLNTPKGTGTENTRSGITPVATVSTSFFFSDVAGLPRTAVEDKNICISPLATQKRGASQQTPVDMKEIFSSPAERKYRAANNNGANPSLDAVVMAERDLMEDEDLSVLLQLASNSTPRRQPVITGKSSNEKLQLPVIGSNGKVSGKPKLQQKNSNRKPPQDDFAPPQLGMRTSSGGSDGGATKDNKEVYAKNANQKNCKKSSFPPPPYPDNPYYTAMPPGSMRVTIGATNKKGTTPPLGTTPTGKSPPPPPRFEYPYPPHMSAYPYMAAYPPYSVYPPPPPPPPPRSQNNLFEESEHLSTTKKRSKKDDCDISSPNNNVDIANKRKSIDITVSAISKTSNKAIKSAKKISPKKKNKSPTLDKAERAQAALTIQNLNAAAGGRNDKAAALAAAILRGVTMRPSGKWQAQLYFCGKSRYIGVFDTREKAALAYEIARDKLKSGHVKGSDGATIENLVNEARKAAFDGVSEQL